MELSDNWFAYINAGRIHAWNLKKGGKETLNLPFNQSELAVESMAIDDKKGLLAIGGKFENAYIYNLNKPGSPQTIKLPGFSRVLRFMKGSASPVLMIGQKGQLLLWQKGKGNIASYKTGKSWVTDINVTGSNIIVLAGNPDKIFTFKK